MGAFGLGSVAGGLLGGYLADRVGRRPVLLLSLVGTTTILCFFGLLETPAAILAAVVAFGLVGEMYRPASGGIIADAVDANERAYAFGVMYAAVNLGIGVGAVVGGILATIDFQWLFWIDAATTGAFALIALFFVAETRPPEGSLSEGGARAKEQPSSVLATARQIGGDRPFLLFCLAGLFTGLVFMQLMSTLPVYLDQHGVAADGYGRLVSINCAIIVLFQLPTTSFLMRFNRANTIIASAVFTGIGFGLVGVAEGFWQYGLTVAILTVGEVIGVPFQAAVVTDMAPPEYRARYLGFHMTAFWSAMMFGGPVGGYVLSHLGAPWLWGGAFVLGMVSALLYLSIRKHISSPPEAVRRLQQSPRPV
jgi:MFS family permease